MTNLNSQLNNQRYVMRLTGTNIIPGMGPNWIDLVGGGRLTFDKPIHFIANGFEARS